MSKVIRLYSIKRDSTITGLEVSKSLRTKAVPVTLKFHHLDGMYSYCTIITAGYEHAAPVHLSVSTPLVKIGNRQYRIATPEEEAESK